MGNIGSSEIFVVLLIALLVLGPTRLPEAARQIGKAISQFRKVTSGLQTEVRDAFSEFEREIKVDDDAAAPPTFPAEAGPTAVDPTAVVVDPVLSRTEDLPPPAETAWVFPDMTPIDPEPAVAPEKEPVTELSAPAKPEHES